MNLVAQLQSLLVQEKLFSSNDEINISLSIGDINRKKNALTKRYIVSKNSMPLFMARFIPKKWLFEHDDISKTYSIYSSLTSVKVPRLIGIYQSTDGIFYLEEYLKSPVSLASMVERNELDASKALAIVRDLFSEIWGIAQKPSKEFFTKEKRTYREYLMSFVQEGILGDVVLDYVDKTIDEYSDSLRQSWSTGDLMDRNILRSGKDWYLIDFEYSHKTLFLFKDAFRSVLYSSWAKNYSLRDVFPGLGDFPEDVAKLLSLSWDEYLQNQIVDERSHRPNQDSLRRKFWDVFDSALLPRLDKKTATLQQVADQKEIQVVQLQKESRSQQQTLKERDEQISQFQKDNLAHQQASAEQQNQIMQLQHMVQNLEKTVALTKDEVAKLQNDLFQRVRVLAEKDQEILTLQQTVASTHNKLITLQNVLAEKDQEILNTQRIVNSTKDELVKLRKFFEQQNKNLQSEIANAKEQINQLRNQTHIRQRLLAEKDKQLVEFKFKTDQSEKRQKIIYSSIGFKLLKLFWAVKDTLLSAIFSKMSGGDSNEQEVQTPIQSVALPPIPEEIITVSSDIAPTTDLSIYQNAYSNSLQMAQNKTSDDFVPLAIDNFGSQNALVKLIAFYLPQFHPIPENDAWWGKGFTEWNNVSKAVPQFEGHYQPHLPGELGFYDLRVPDVQRRQVELAKKYGIYGFCFHYYWFNGKRLLERPLNQFISDPEIDFPFCICWANENWTRRWDGQENDILIAQVHSEESDIAFIKDIEPLLRNKHYITINERPLIVVYRVHLMPNPASTVGRWKEYCKKVGINEPYFVAAQSFGFTDPRDVKYDAAVEFPPHNIAVEEITQHVILFNPEFEGRVCAYQGLVEKMQDYNKGKPYTVFKTVSPGWDNEPRKPGRGHVYAYSSPDLYKSWLDTACKFAIQNPTPDEQIVFINAWNEWAESAYLEPDMKYGYAYLEATKQVLKSYTKSRYKTSVIVPNYNHEAFIERRLESIINQSVKPDEIIFLDDASTDHSLSIAENMLQRSNIKYQIIPNKTNSNSVFKQWLKGIEIAKGDLIWVAESDDEADKDFLKKILPQFDRGDVLLTYGNISYINPDDSKNDGLSNYYDGLSPDKWKSSHISSAHDLFSGDFAVKNIIPNVSGAVFRKPILGEDEVKRLTSYHFAGDWYFYALISRGGSISYCNEAKSYFRLNRDSTSRQAFFTKKHIDEHKMILQDLRALYGISEETVERHIAELKRVLSLQGIADQKKNMSTVLKSVQPTNVREKLKICIASHGFSIGGGELVPIMLANTLRSCGHHITFLIMNPTPQDDSPSLFNRLRPDIPIVNWQDYASKFESFQKEFGFDLINSHNVEVEYKLFNNHIMPNVPYVASLHGGYETVPNILKKDFITYLSHTVDIWLYLSEKNIAPLINNGLKDARFEKVFNAVTLDKNQASSYSSVRAQLNIPKNCVVLVLASRAIHDKGWGIAIDTTRRLRKETGRDVRLVLIGDGEDLLAIQELAKGAPYVYFMGRVENAGAIIGDCDFGIFPSTYKGESFPLFILECFAAGLPVIACDVGAIREMMTSDSGEVAGVLITPNQDSSLVINEITETLKTWLHNEEMLKAARTRASRRADHYNIRKLVEKYLDIFDSVCKRKST